MELKTVYMGLELEHPLIAAASPFVENVDKIKKLEDSGAAAVVLPSVFEEQLRSEALELAEKTEQGSESFAEALTYFPEPDTYKTGPEEYLQLIQKAKKQVKIPVIASLNASAPASWADYSKKIEQAGADALELNIYSIPRDFQKPGSEIEKESLAAVKAAVGAVKIPVAVKLSQQWSNLAHLSGQMAEAKVKGLVLFNRFYQPDINLETLSVETGLTLSNSEELKPALRWIAMLYGRTEVDFAAAGGVNTAADVLKAVMVGAKVTQLCSAVYKNGPEIFKTLKAEIIKWLEEKEYISLNQALGSVSQKKLKQPGLFERAQYMKTLIEYQG
jgi:dihydroorotate dehydrogenase (fumarate)